MEEFIHHIDNIFDINNDTQITNDELLSNKKKLLNNFINNNINNNSNYIISKINNEGIIENNFMMISKNGVLIQGNLNNNIPIHNATNVNIVSNNFIFDGDLHNNNLKNGIMKTENFEYSGTFLYGLFHGNGIIKFYNTDFFYNGLFENGKYNGFGYSYLNNILYSGNFVNGLYEGFGIMLEHNILYNGTFKNGLKHNEGIELSFTENFLTQYNNNIDLLRFIELNIDTIINTIEYNPQLTIYDNNTLISTKTKLQQDYEQTKFKLEELQISYNNLIAECSEYKSQLNEIRNTTPSLLCTICITDKIDVILQPCNHIIMCKQCCNNTFTPVPRYNMISNSTNNINNNYTSLTSHTNNKCPVCRAKVSRFTEVFIN